LTELFSGAPFAIQNSRLPFAKVVEWEKKTRQNKYDKAQSLAAYDSAINSTQYKQVFESFVDLFQKENEMVKNALLRIQEQPQPILQQQQQYRTMPMNCNDKRMGMGSYPSNFDATIADTQYHSPRMIRNKLGEIRSMVYPTIDLIYQACNAAKVDCGHVYVHRPPNQVLQSTVSNRLFHNSLLEAIQLYTTVLQRIESDLRNYSHRNWGCIGLYDDEVTDILSAFTTTTNNTEDIPHNNSTSTSSTATANYPLWFNITPALLGFDNPTKWATYMKSKLKPSISIKSEQKQRKSSTFQKKLHDKYQHLQIYKIFVEQHHRTIQACKGHIVAIA